MINFRYHVVSIIAVFLALAIGTVLGSAFVGRGVIDRLQNRIDSVEKTSNEQKATNEQLETENGQVGRYVDQTQDYSVGHALAGTRIDLVAERGVDGGIVDQQATLLRAAGATVPGVVWLEESWKLSDANDLVALRDATGTTNRMPVPLRNAAAEVLGRRLAGAAPAADDVLTKLADKKFVTLSGVAGSPTPAPSEIFGDAARTLVIGGPAVAIPDDLVPAVVGGVIAGGAKVAVAQAFVATEEVTERASWIDSIANADALRGRVSTIDDEERTEGRVASTLALAELGTGAAGNYGLGRDRAVPDKVVTVPTAR